jgi:hypothetical protein
MRSLRALRRPAVALVAALLLASCGGGSHGSAPTPAGGGSGALANAKFAFTIPAASAAPAASGREPLYIPASTASLRLSVTASTEPGFSGPLTQTLNVTPGASGATYNCTTVAAGNYTCTTTFPIPPGTDTLTITSFDAANAGGQLLSQQIVAETVVAGAANDFTASPITLDAAPGSVTVTPPGAGVTGSVATGFTVTGLSAVVFGVQALDSHGTAFSGQPGTPSLKVVSSAPAVATAALNGPPATQLTLTPVATGTTSVGLYTIAPHGAGSTVFTTAAAAILSGATSFTVASATGITNGATLILDSGANQETVHVTTVSGTTVNLSAGTAHAHALAAPVADPGSDGLSFGAVVFNVTIETTLVALGGCGSSACQIDEFSYGGGAFTERGTPIPNSSFPAGANIEFMNFDSANTLYSADDNDYTIEEFPFVTATQSSSHTSSPTITTGLNGNTNAPFGFEVSSNGTIAASLETSSEDAVNVPVGPQLVAYQPGATSASPTHLFANVAGSDFSGGPEGTEPTSAVLTGSTGAVFGYAVTLVDQNTNVNNRIGVYFSDGTFLEISDGIVGNYSNPTNPMLAWDQAAQSLIFVDTSPSGTGTSGVLEYKYSGSDTFAAHSLLHTLSGYGEDLTISRDGEIGVAYECAGDTESCLDVYNKSTRANEPGWTAKVSPGTTVNAIHFFPDDSFLVIDGNTAYVYGSSGSVPGTTISGQVTPGDVPSGWVASDGAISN